MQRFRTLLALTVGSLALAACAAGPDYHRPPVSVSAEKPFIGSTSPAVLTTQEPQGDWWRLYQDATLDSLVADALKANTDLRVALANIEKARALLRESRSDLLPQTSVAPDGITVAGLVARGRHPHQGLLRQWSDNDERVVEESMAATRVSDLADRHVDELSGGQRQRVWIAMALAQQTPDVTFVGRLATYRYYNMDQVVGQALATYRRISERDGRQAALSSEEVKARAAAAG